LGLVKELKGIQDEDSHAALLRTLLVGCLFQPSKRNEINPASAKKEREGELAHLHAAYISPSYRAANDSQDFDSQFHELIPREDLGSGYRESTSGHMQVRRSVFPVTSVS
jgi:hypothetical protein